MNKQPQKIDSGVTYRRGKTMKTTLNLPEHLLENAMQITHSSTKTLVVTKALEELIKKNKIQKLRAYKGKINLDIDIDHIRDRCL